ncbi:DUF4828 domain-containing protein [Vagococcus coleopterorum]|uniref:DUF4828 domain-containing protein n=1 Tax=Vagococcus coleopterorum TaxID=2714946 RepID=A0A6G8AL12_9ENTE|nr:DUF4828 domain-containing protein [Vagococcus coleopterorum]QIL45677.1 DUF4828 domain-containing protein [Vagococcus coleopterorum]
MVRKQDSKNMSLTDLVLTKLPFLKKKQTKQGPSEKIIKKQYVGRWYVFDRTKSIQHSLEIKPDFSMLLDNGHYQFTLITLTEEKLVLRDRLGYFITITCKDQQPVSLFDEAENKTYDLEK